MKYNKLPIFCFEIMSLSFCSCLIARNMLSGLKTCAEVFSYMHNGGSSMQQRSTAAPTSLIKDSGEADMTYRVGTKSPIWMNNKERNKSQLSQK